MKKILQSTQERHYKIEPMERAVSEAGTPVFRGRAVVFEQWSNLLYNDFKEIIHVGAASKARMDRALAVFNHKEDKLLGSYDAGTLRVRSDETGIYVEIDEAETTISKDCAEWVKRGEIRGMSFKFTVPENGSKWEYDESAMIWRHYISEIDEILDFSLVTRAAYPQTTATHELARSMGFDPEAVKEKYPVKSEENEIVERQQKLFNDFVMKKASRMSNRVLI